MKVLVAEDDAISALVLRKALEKLGHDVWVEPNGEQAWDILHGQPFQLVISDWMMPKLSGIELCRRIRSQYHKAYVYLILLTVKSDEDDRTAAFEAGVDDFLVKPIDPAELVSRIEIAQRMLQMKAQLNHPKRTGAMRELGQILVEQGIITNHQLNTAISEQIETRRRIGDILCRHGWATEDDIAQARALQMGIPYIDLNKVTPDTTATELISYDIAQRYHIVPISIDNSGEIPKLKAACETPWDSEGIDLIQRLTKHEISVVLAAPYAIQRVLKTLYNTQNEETEESQNHSHNAFEKTDTKRILNITDSLRDVLSNAVLQNASSIHIDITNDKCRLFYRIDGNLKLNDMQHIDQSLINDLTGSNNIKTAETFILPYLYDSREHRLTVSILPYLHGRRIVIEGFKNHHTRLTIDELGLTTQDFTQLCVSVLEKNGLTILSGPAGSGKATTAYALLERIQSQSPALNIITCENGYRYELNGVIQTNHNGIVERHHIKTILQQDPDVIYVDGIIDRGALELLLQASQKSIRCIYSLNAVDAGSAIHTLLASGISPYMLAPAINGIVSQRLFNKLCPQCRSTVKVTPDEAYVLGNLGYEQNHRYQADGCDQCSNGFSGKTAVFELTKIDAPMRKWLLSASSQDQVTIYQSNQIVYNALTKVASGEILLSDMMVTFGNEIEEILTEGKNVRLYLAA